jgi:hypothetical protein
MGLLSSVVPNLPTDPGIDFNYAFFFIWVHKGQSHFTQRMFPEKMDNSRLILIENVEYSL